jgi:hypothetical protein
MPIRQTRIFVPSSDIDSDWAETLIGRVFRPVSVEFEAALEWFWFSRYGSPAEESADCDIKLIPEDYKHGGFHRSMRFRFSVADEVQSDFERRVAKLVSEGGYRISDFRDYNFVADTGSNRFLGLENRQPGREQQRAKLTTTFYWITSRLVIDSLVGPDERGRFRMERNDDTLQNPRNSTFQSVLHLFCNITSVPTDVYVWQKPSMNLIGYGTFMYRPPEPEGGWEQASAFPIRF